MRVIVCGGRNFSDRRWVYKCLDAVGITVLIHGAARGADSLASHWATERGIKQIPCPANWDKHGNAAGFLRNKRMLLHDPQYVVAFPGGKGTASMVKLARQAGVCCEVYGENPNTITLEDIPY